MADIKLHFNNIAKDYDKWKRKNWYYYSSLKEFYSTMIPQDSYALEVGSATGEILNCVKPRRGVGLDISKKMTELAKDKFPHLEFNACSIEDYPVRDKFEYVIMCDLLDHVLDLWKLFKDLDKFTKAGTRLVITTINPMWDRLLEIAEKFGLKMPEGPHNFLFKSDIINLLKLFSYQIESQGYFLLLPFYIPIISEFFNRYVIKVGFLKQFCFVQYIIACKKGPLLERNLSCSVIVPCFNEEGNIEACARRIPLIGKFTEIIFVDDGSTDKTKERIEKVMKENKNVKLVSYFPNRGKAHAIRMGFNAASGDVLIILDADMAVAPEELEKFLWAISKDGIDFVNGTRMIYVMEKQAMRSLNRLGNKIFGAILTWLLGQRITDTLCGTKAILKEDYYKIPRTDYDRWGDFDLLLGAAKLNLRIVEMPVQYKRRLKGLSKMKPLKHSFILFLRCLIGFKELKLKRWLQKFCFNSCVRKHNFKSSMKE